MRLSAYFAEQRARGVRSPELEFSRRSGVPRTTLDSIVNGCIPKSDTAVKIVRASGGLVTHEDLAAGERGAA